MSDNLSGSSISQGSLCRQLHVCIAVNFLTVQTPKWSCTHTHAYMSGGIC